MKARKLLIATLVLTGAAWASADDKKDGQAGIAWYGTWKRGLEAAGETQKPILLVAAAPQCHGISGMW